MKKLLFTLISFICLTANATDLWEGSHAVNWENTINITADKFADIKAGDKIVLDITVQNEDVVELKSNGQKLPGTRFHTLYSDNKNIEVFLTDAAVSLLKSNGLEVCGWGFTVSKVWYGDGKDNVTENTAWTGFFWMDSWSTIEIWKESLPTDLSKYSAVRFISEAGRTNYVINVLASWDGGDKIADQSTMTMTNEYAELDLTKLTADQKALFFKTDRIMIQCNKEGGDPFNFTAVEFIPAQTPVEGVSAEGKNVKAVKYNLAGQKVSANYRGVTISNGMKYMKK